MLALEWMEGVLRGLEAIHREGLIHRDMKPDNVLLGRDEDGEVIPKVTDLGIAHNQEGTRLTRDGSQLGTFEYMAPEQFQSRTQCAKRHLRLRDHALRTPGGHATLYGNQGTVITGHLMTAPDLTQLPADVPQHVHRERGLGEGSSGTL